MSLDVVDWSPDYQEVRLDTARVLKISRAFPHEAESFYGVFVATSDEARLFLVIHDVLIADGASLVRPRDIAFETAEPTGEFMRSVVETKLAGALPLVPKLSAITFPAFCNWLRKAGVSAAFFKEESEDAGRQVGRVASVEADAVVVDTVTTSGEPDGPWRIRFDDLTRIDCLGEYERSFDLVRAGA